MLLFGFYERERVKDLGKESRTGEEDRFSFEGVGEGRENSRRRRRGRADSLSSPLFLFLLRL